jgi:broad specificity phosphatase PhoE
VPASQLHLVRHGEVDNPRGILYGQLPGYHLSELGRRMAAAAAASVKAAGAPVTRVVASPLERAQESAEPFAEAFGLPVETDDRLIEPANRFEGRTFEFGPQVILRPQAWAWVVNPFRPSWGEAYRSIADRMLAALEAAWRDTEHGDVVLVSHQLPIWTATNEIAGRRLWHDPRTRRCSLSSITTFERGEDGFVEVAYRDPAAELLAQAVDSGAV